MTFTVIRVGAETRVNTTTVTHQKNPSITALDGGGWIVTWQSLNQDGSGTGIYQQRYTSEGAAVGGESLVNTFTPNPQDDPDVTSLADGGWVVAWQSSLQDGDNYGVYQQRYNADGTLRGVETIVNTTTASSQAGARLTALSDGGWTVTWVSKNQDDPTSAGIYQQRYDATGAKVAGEVLVNTTTAGDQLNPTVEGLADGGWVVAWHSEYDGSSSGIYQQRFKADGTRDGAETIVNTTISDTQSFAKVAGLVDGGWVVTWTSKNQDGSNYGIYQQRYNVDGSAHGVETLASTRRPRIISSGRAWPRAATAAGLSPGNPGTRRTPPAPTSISNATTPTDRRAVPRRSSMPRLLTSRTRRKSRPSRTVAGSLPGSSRGQTAEFDYGIFQRYYQATGETVLRNVAETAIGTGADETLSVAAGGVSAGDILDGGAGTDTLVLLETGPLDLTQASSFTGFKIFHGSAGNDAIITTGALLAGVTVIDGKGGTNTLRLEGGGAVNLSPIAVSNIMSITLQNAAGTHLTLDDKATALLVRGNASATDSVTVTGETLTVQEREILFSHGIETVTDDAGTFTNSAPAALALAGAAVSELAANGDVVGTLSVTDPDAPNDAHTYTLVDDAGGRFDIVGDKIVVKNRALLNYEQQPTSYPVIVRVTDAGGLALAKQFTISVTDENEAPTAIALSGTGIGENASDGATVGTLSFTDPDAPNGLHVYTLLDNAGGRFAIVGDKIVVKNGALLDYEQATSHVVTVRVTDAGNLHVDRQFNIFLTDVNETPAPRLAQTH